MNNRVYRRLDKQIGDKISVRRYSLPAMISESYKTLYDCKKGSNMQNLVESHIEDMRDNPQEIERLSRQLTILKEVSRMVESRTIKDSDLVDKESYDTVSPKKERALRQDCLDDSLDPDCGEEKLYDEEDTLEDEELTEEEVDALTAHLKDIRKKKSIKETYDEDSEEDQAKMDALMTKLADTFHIGELPPDLDQKYLEAIDLLFDVIYPSEKSYDESVDPDSDDKELTKRAIKQLKNAGGKTDDLAKEYKDKYKEDPFKESKSYNAKSLKEFSEKSKDKAFTKTFKKLADKLHEGNALTRQESINLYKAANSAMTHLTVELEKNPEFIETFRESASILSKDINSILEATKNGKAPSKKTMKSLSKFYEALMNDSDEAPYKLRLYNKSGVNKGNLSSEETFSDLESMSKRYAELFNAKDYALNPTAWEKDENGDWTRIVGFSTKGKMNEADEEVEDIEDPEIEDEEVVAPEEEEVPEEDEVVSDFFDQEYADARIELHQDLAAKHADDEDPAVQDKLEQDKQEILSLDGITDDQVAALESEETPVPQDEEIPTEEEVHAEDEPAEDTEDEEDSDITDDELAELKKYLKEMRESKK